MNNKEMLDITLSWLADHEQAYADFMAQYPEVIQAYQVSDKSDEVEAFKNLATQKAKEIVSLYKQLGEDKYITMFWINGAIHIMNNEPTGGTPNIDFYFPFE